ncbi:SOS response-associated peptidase [Salana multivorans]
MCGRYAAFTSADELEEDYDVDRVTEAARELAPSWNTAPTDAVRIILDRVPKETVAAEGVAAEAPEAAGADARASDAERLTRELHVARWGLLPSWSKGPSGKGAPLFNARLESVADKPAFARSLLTRRCLVPADGYFEWRKNEAAHPEQVKAGTMPAKTPFFITDPTGATLAFAGLYSWWRDPTKAEDDPERWVLSSTILTQKARDGLESIHDREPVILSRESIAAWLDPSITTADEALGILAEPGPALEWYEVGPGVGSVRNNDPGLIRRVG